VPERPPKRRGRPPLDPHDVSVSVNLRVTTREYDALYQLAREARCSIPALVRAAWATRPTKNPRPRIAADTRRPAKTLSDLLGFFPGKLRLTRNKVEYGPCATIVAPGASWRVTTGRFPLWRVDFHSGVRARRNTDGRTKIQLAERKFCANKDPGSRIFDFLPATNPFLIWNGLLRRVTGAKSLETFCSVGEA